MAAFNNIPAGGWGGAQATPQYVVAGGSPSARPQPPVIQLIGETGHPDFRDAIDLLQCDARLATFGKEPPELVIVAQSRPDTISSGQLHALRREVPLAGIVALLGSWCEGESRTGRPWPGAHRLYWYEFPAWWRRQLSLRAAGRCPDWARPANFGFPISDCGLTTSEPGRPRPRGGLVVLHTPRRETAEALAGVLQRAGYSTAWQPPGRPRTIIRGAVAGIWDGGQLNDAESADLAEFCAQLAHDAAAVVALLDFPRRDRVQRALEIGAAYVLGKPWLNSALIETLNAADCAKHIVDAA